MDEKPQQRWRWLIWLVAIVIAAPVLLLLLVQVFFITHQIPNERMAPPAELVRSQPLQPKPKPNSTPNYAAAAQTGDYLAFAKAKSPQSEPVRIYEKWKPRAGQLFAEMRNPQDWDAWLAKHRDLVDDLIQIDKAGGLPIISDAEADLIGDDHIIYMWTSYEFRWVANSVLTHEIKRRRDLGDIKGATEAAFARESIEAASQSYVWFDDMYLYSKFRTLSEIARLAANPIPLEVAKWMRERISSSPPMDCIPVLQREYRRQRKELVQMLSGSYSEILHSKLKRVGYTSELNFWNVADHLREAPRKFINDYWQVSAASIWLKGSAATLLDQYDNTYRECIDRVRHNRFNKGTPKFSWSWMQLVYIAPDVFGRTVDDTNSLPNAIQAQLNLDLMGLDMIIDKKPALAVMRSDPFTSAPLKVIEQTSTTLIYSIGPNLTDERGAINYDPTNGSISPGDITITIPRH